MKTFFKILASLILICILGAFIFLFVIWSRLPDMASNELSETLGVPVEIGDIRLSPSQITVQSLDIGNPSGFHLNYALAVQSIDILAPFTNYFRNDIVIDEIDLNNVYIGLEFDSPKGTRGNWSAILNHTEKSQASSTEIASEKTVLIRKLVLTNIQPDLLYRSDGKIRQLPIIPRMELNNISSRGGNFSDQLMNSALGQMIKEIFVQENLKNALDNIFRQIPGGNGGPVDVLRGFFGTAEEKN
jgi:uncharacterized protein involved in outer membrane biogenesis